MNTTRTFFSVLLCVTALGCNAPDDPLEQFDSAGSTPDREEVFLFNISVNELDKNTATNRFPNPSQDLLRERFEAIDWEDTQRETHVVLQTPTGSDTISISRLEESGDLLAAWSEQKEGRWKHLYCSPVSQPDAFELLSSLLTQDNRHRELVEWKDEDDE